jgi:hypothetical protein
MKKKICSLLLLGSSLFGCSPFYMEAQNDALMHKESGLYVHREVELRVNAARLTTPPDTVPPNAVSTLDASHFTPISVSSAWFDPTKSERRGEFLIWRETTHLPKYAVKGKMSLGATVRWEKEGAVTVKDTLEMFPFPLPEISQIDHWTPWVEAGSRREGTFAWHSEVNRHDAENPDRPEYPFQMRFRLVLSQRVYP